MSKDPGSKSTPLMISLPTNATRSIRLGLGAAGWERQQALQCLGGALCDGGSAVVCTSPGSMGDQTATVVQEALQRPG